MLLMAPCLYAADRLLYENFDDGELDERLVVYGRNWATLSPPQYNLDSVGRGASGYCFSSGTVNEAHLNWGALGKGSMPNPWPSDEMYVSFWMRYPSYTETDDMENFKVFYPHWDGTSSYVHYSMSSDDTIYYSACAQGEMVSISNWLSCPNQTDGVWHHYEFYVKFSTGVSRFWYDGVLKVDHEYGAEQWTNAMYYISAPSIDAEEPGTFSRQVDDLEVWDGMPDEEDPPSPSGYRSSRGKTSLRVGRH